MLSIPIKIILLDILIPLSLRTSFKDRDDEFTYSILSTMYRNSFLSLIKKVTQLTLHGNVKISILLQIHSNDRLLFAIYLLIDPRACVQTLSSSYSCWPTCAAFCVNSPSRSPFKWTSATSKSPCVVELTASSQS